MTASKTSRRSPRKRKSAPPSSAAPSGLRRSEIQGIAAGLFVLKGFEGTTMREIAAASGVLPGSLYHHFTSKEEILHEIMRPFLRHTLDLYRDIVRRGEPPAITLRNLVDAALTISLDEPATHSILMHQWAFLVRSPRFSYVIRSWRDTHRLWAGVIRAGVEAREFREGVDIHLTTHLVLEQISSTVFWSPFKSKTVSVADIRRAHVELLMSGLLRTSGLHARPA